MFTAVIDSKEMLFYNHIVAMYIIVIMWVFSLPLYGVVVLVVNRVLPLKVVRSLIDYLKLKCCNRHHHDIMANTVTESGSLPHRFVHCQDYASIN